MAYTCQMNKSDRYTQPAVCNIRMAGQQNPYKGRGSQYVVMIVIVMIVIKDFE